MNQTLSFAFPSGLEWGHSVSHLLAMHFETRRFPECCDVITFFFTTEAVTVRGQCLSGLWHALTSGRSTDNLYNTAHDNLINEMDPIDYGQIPGSIPPDSQKP